MSRLPSCPGKRPALAALLAAAAVMGLSPAPKESAEQWINAPVSSPQWESHPAIDPRTGDLWFVRSDKSFAGWRLMIARCADGRWTVPKNAPVSSSGLEADPWISRDGRSLWFISTRATGSNASADLDIYRARRKSDGSWGTPSALPPPVNSGAAEWFPRPARDGWLYFGSRRAGGLGKDDIWRARRTNGRWVVENLGPAINTAGAEYELQPAPDGRWGILSTDQGLFRVVATNRGWRRDRKYGPSINTNGSEIGPMIAHDGDSFIFSRDSGADWSGELFIAYTSNRAGRTPECPPSRLRTGQRPRGYSASAVHPLRASPRPF